MVIVFSCPNCQKSFKVAEEHAGKTTKCQSCGSRMTIPAPRNTPASKPAVAAGMLQVKEELKACPFCGEKVLAAAKKCKHCGEVIDVALRAAEEARKATERPSQTPMVFMNAGGGGGGASSAAASSAGGGLGLPEAGKSRIVAAILAIFFGWLGVHKFYLGKGFQGVLYLIFFWSFIPAILSLIEGISYLGMSDRKFAEKYG